MGERATTPVAMGFMPAEHALPDPDHPGLLRAGPRAAAPYGEDGVEVHTCDATDLSQVDAASPDLATFGFDMVDLSGVPALQEVFARTRSAGRITEDDGAAVRSALDGAVLPLLSGSTVTVLHVAGEGLIMRKAGPAGRSVVGPRSVGMNDHGGATSVHADQDVHGTPLTQLMDGRAPELFRHDSPDGSNRDAGLMLVNLWVPLQQVVQPLVLADGRSIDRRRHQLRYGLPTDTFLERDEDQVINDIWTFLHHPDQRWYLRSDMDHRNAWIFDTCSTAHGACTLPGEDVAERCFVALEEAEAAAASGDAAALARAVATVGSVEVPAGTPPALRDAVGAMAAVLDDAGGDPDAASGSRAGEWSARSLAARTAVVRMSLELRMVVSTDT